MDYSKPFKYILEIANCQSISLAAERLNIQQPALSKYLKKVETELGVELFDRSSTPIKLTDAGKCYIETAHKVIDADNQLQKQILDIQKESSCINVGVAPSRAPYIMPIILAAFVPQASDVPIQIYEGTINDLNSKLQTGELDLIISVRDNSTNDFMYTKLFDEIIYLAVPKNKDISSFSEAVNKYKIISPPKGQLLSELSDKLSKFVSHIECHNIVTALSLVESGIGSTLVPSYVSQYAREKGISLYSLPENISPSTNREVCIFYRKEQFLSNSEKLFIQSAVEATSINK